MRNPERSSRRITSIPSRTSLNVSRCSAHSRIGGGSSQVAAEPDQSFVVAEHVFRKPQRLEKAGHGFFYEMDGKIEWEAEVVENYNNKGGLGIILQFSGIRLPEAPFLRGRLDYGQDSAVFYTRIDYKNQVAYLILATRGDIFESQIVPGKIDVDPFFQEELYLPQLTRTHDPASMAIFQNNKLITVSYNPHSY